MCNPSNLVAEPCERQPPVAVSANGLLCSPFGCQTIFALVRSNPALGAVTADRFVRESTG